MSDNGKSRGKETRLLRIENTDRVCKEAQRTANELIRLAEKGEELAAVGLIEIAARTVGALNSIAKARPDLIVPLSRKTPFWPAFISRKR